MAFHDILFPVNIAWGASGGPKFKTAVFTADSGHEQRTLDWKEMRAEYDVSHKVKRDEERDELLDFFMARRGMAYGFRFKDWNDYTLRQEVIGFGDGVSRRFPITKLYTSAQGDGESWTYSRRISKIEWGSISGVTVGGELASRATKADFSDLSPTVLNAYFVDEDAGIMAFKTAPFGLRYEGTSPVTGLTLLTSEMYGFHLANTLNDALAVDYSTGKVHFRAYSLSRTGMRRMDLATGVEELEKISTTIGFPQSSPSYDNREIEAVVAAGDGCVYVAVGGSNRQVLYKLDGADYSILASNGVGGGSPPAAGEIGTTRYLGCLSRNGERLMHVDLLGSAHVYSIFATDDLAYQTFANVGEITTTMIGPCCPMYDSGFAMLLNRPNGVELWDDNNNMLAVFGKLGCIANWCVWDNAADDKGVIVSYRDSAAVHYMAKYSVTQQKVVWNKQVPIFGVPAPNTPVSGELVALSGNNIFRINTASGLFASRAVVETYQSGVHAWSPVSQTIITSPAGPNGRGKFIDTDISGVSYSEQVEIKIGYGEFHVPVRFNTDHIDLSNDSYGVSSWTGISLVEVRDWYDLGLGPRPVEIEYDPDEFASGFEWVTATVGGGSAAFPTANEACRRQWEEFAVGITGAGDSSNTTFLPALVRSPNDALCMWSYGADGTGSGVLPTVVYRRPIEQP